MDCFLCLERFFDGHPHTQSASAFQRLHKEDKAIKLLDEADTSKGVGLIDRVKQGQGKPTKISVKNFLRPSSLQGDVPAYTAEANSAETRSQDIGKAKCNYIDMSYTYLNYVNPSIHQEPYPNRTPHPGWIDWINEQRVKTSQEQILYKQKISGIAAGSMPLQVKKKSSPHTRTASNL